jgi:uroporphyrinogen decarboxylase
MTIDLRRREPCFEEFLKVLRREGEPAYLPFYEHLASSEFIARRTGTEFHRLPFGEGDYWKIYVDFWLGMGYDCIPMEVGPNCPLRESEGEGFSHQSESRVMIRNMQEFEEYPWPPDSSPIEFKHFEKVAELLPEGVKIVGGVGGGPFEWATSLLGVMGLSLALYDCPELVEAVFGRLSSLCTSAHRQLATMESLGALRQGDDLGYKTATFLSPEDLRRLVFPIYKNMVSAAHEAGKPFILHSCGNLANVYEDLIVDCGIDAKHSFEDTICPVEDFKKQYGDRVTALGGLDVDFICRRNEKEIREYARKKIEACFEDRYWALGTGNSLTDYMPVENYLFVLEEGLRFG